MSAMGDRIQRLLDRRGMSARELSRRIGGVSHATVNRWIEGKGEPRLSVAVRVAEELGCSLRYLADDRDDREPESLTADEQYVLSLFRDLGLSTAVAVKRLAGAVPASPAGQERDGEQDRSRRVR